MHPQSENFHSPGRKIPLERDRKLNHACPPSSLATAPGQTCRTLPGACEGARHSSRYCPAARKIPYADGSPDSSRDRHRPQAPITPKRTARKIPRLPVPFGGPVRPDGGNPTFFHTDRALSTIQHYYMDGGGHARMQEQASLPRFHKNLARPPRVSGPFLALTWT